MKSNIFFLIFLTAFLIFTKASFSQNASEFRPTQPPRIPVTDFGDGAHRVFDFLYMHYDFKEFTMDGGGAGFNYTDNNNAIAYNIGIGAIYMEGSSTELKPQLNVYDTNLPLNGNIGLRLAGNQNTSNLMFFFGFNWMYTWLTVTYGDNDAFAYGPAYGPIGGLKAEVKLSPSISFIPYYILQNTNFDLTVEVNGIEQDVDIAPVTSHMFGFDIKFGAVSIGALLDTINNTDNNKIMIMFSYDLDYATDIDESSKNDLNSIEETREEDINKTKTDKVKKPVKTK